MKNLENLERSLTKYVAEMTDKTVDVDIFRGQIPQNKELATAVFIQSINIPNAYQHQSYSVQVLSRLATRSNALTLYNQLLEKLPASSIVVDNFKMLKIKLASTGGLYKTTHNGKDYYAVSVTLDVVAYEVKTYK